MKIVKSLMKNNYNKIYSKRKNKKKYIKKIKNKIPNNEQHLFVVIIIQMIIIKKFNKKIRNQRVEEE